MSCFWLDGVRTCNAFPDGIPDEIWRGKVSHRVPYDGDAGIKYINKYEIRRGEHGRQSGNE